MKNYWPYVKNNTALKLVIATLVSAVLYWMSSFLLPILLSVGLAFALYPVSNAFSKITLGKSGFHLSRVVAIILAFFVLALFLGIVVTMVVLPLFGQVNALLLKLPEYSDKIQSDSLGWLFKDTSTKYPLLPSNISSLIDESINWIMGFVSGVVRNLLRSTLNIVANLFGLIVVPFLAFYFLKDWRILKAMLIDAFNVSSRSKVNQVLSRIGNALSSYVVGLWKLSLLAGCCITLTLVLLKVPYPLVFGFIAVLAETIPVVGPLISAIPAIFVAYTLSPHTALILTIFYAIYYTIDGQVLVPVIMGRKIDLHPVIIILALMIGAKLFGILGMFFAVPVAAIYRVLYKELWHYDGSEHLHPTELVAVPKSAVKGQAAGQDGEK